MGYWDPPDFEDYPCDVCGEMEDNCICPECPECNNWGDPTCYLNHGLQRTEEQKFSFECANRWWERQARAEAMDWKSIIDESIFD